MRILIIILLFSIKASAQIVGFLPIYTAPMEYSPTVEGVIIDDGVYNGFPMTDTMNNGNIFSFYKKSYDHAGAGYMMLNQTSDGGVTNNEHKILVGTDTIIMAAYSMGVIRSTGRILIAYQDNELYNVCKFAYSDDNGATFTFADSINVPDTIGISPSPIKMIVMPSGKIRMGYYKGFYDGKATIGFIESTDNGLNWNFAEEVYTHYGTGFGDELGYEFAVIITDNTGIDSTCKMAIYVRPYMHFFSSNGGATWQNDLVTVDNPGAYSRYYFYNFGGTAGQAPFDIIEHNDSIYIVTGYRNTNPSSDGYWLEYIVTTKENAYTNNYFNYGAVQRIRIYNAFTLGSEIDCGYPVLFHDRQGKLWVRDYDVSTEPLNPSIAADRCWIYQIKIAD